MIQAVVGIDTSCYLTSCALVDIDGRILADVRLKLNVPQGKRGLRQNEAVFQHVRHMPRILRTVFSKVSQVRLNAVCASNQPMHGTDSYMPVFTVGASFASALSESHRIHCFFTSHQQGHFAAAMSGQQELREECLAVHLSGGTTQVLHLKNTEMTLLGNTLDISAGQLLDRLGVMMGYPFPSGASLEALASTASSQRRYPAIVKDGSVSFSGVEAAAIKDLQAKGLNNSQIAVELFDVIARSIKKMISDASIRTDVRNVLITGGVASSSLFRTLLVHRLEKCSAAIKPYFCLPEYAGDNAVGVALIGLEQYRNQEGNQHGNHS